MALTRHRQRRAGAHARAPAECKSHGDQVSSVLFLSKLQDRLAKRVIEIMQMFPAMLNQAELYGQRGYPPSTWFSLSAVGRA